MITLTPNQIQAFEKIKSFLHADHHQAFVLKGYAGTGKTTIVSQVVAWMEEHQIPFQLLASTGRAAKVLQTKSGKQVSTIHQCVYKLDRKKLASANEVQISLHFAIRSNEAISEETVYIVDEASMISHEVSRGRSQAEFGTGSLLNDFFDFISGRKVIFIGDACQLPPVAKDPRSSALDLNYLLNEAGVPAIGMELTTVVRQTENSGILRIARPFREGARSQVYEKYPKINFAPSNNMSLYPNEEVLVKRYLKDVVKKNYTESIMIVSTNRQVNDANKSIRGSVHGQQDLQPGELLMVVQNSYYVPLSNGDQVIVERVTFDAVREGLTFLKVRVRNLDDGSTHETLLIKDLLYQQNPGLSKSDNDRLMKEFTMRMRQNGISNNSEKYLEQLMIDPYFNALRAKFGYAITCHKSQGGEWPQVYLNIHKSLYGMPGPQLYRWYYTAITRAKDHIHFNDGWWIRKG